MHHEPILESSYRGVHGTTRIRPFRSPSVKSGPLPSSRVDYRGGSVGSARRPPASQHPSWGPSWAAFSAWYSMPNKCGGAPGTYTTASPHIPAVTSPWGALMGGVQRLAFKAYQCGEARHRLHQQTCTPAPPYPCGNQPVGGPYGRRSAPGIPRQTNMGEHAGITPHAGSSAPLLLSRGPIAEGAPALHASPPHPNIPLGPICGREIPAHTRTHPTPQCGGGGICPGISSAGAHSRTHPTPQCSGGGICPGISSAGAHSRTHPTPQCGGGGICPRGISSAGAHPTQRTA